ncbi:hypothetical protein M9H77_34192 [Catharanthus roseus]|uniref:Uncharacterized protein n=1 Tax=Catharanthus roseus TaxID=4058 RepID=A0ACB9ZKI1_CATRO|nr:hypothetical protein M9H77_34192 [Catharanthus roseus]
MDREANEVSQDKAESYKELGKGVITRHPMHWISSLRLRNAGDTIGISGTNLLNRTFERKVIPRQFFDYTKQFFCPKTRSDHFFDDAIAFIFTRTIETSGHTRETEIRLHNYSCFKFSKFLQKFFLP